MRVLAFTKYGREAASTRQRLLQYLPALAEAGITVEWCPLLDDAYVSSLARGTRPSRGAIARGYARRLGQLAGAHRFDALWVYAELFPYLPAAFERLAFASKAPVIYDFDDAFFHQYDDHPRAAMRRLLGGKLEPLVAKAAACCCGNAYLNRYARRLNPRTMILPTVVDTNIYRPLPALPDDVLTIGWIGTPSTWSYLQPIMPLLAELCAQGGVRARVVGAGHVAAGHAFDGLEVIEWRESTEVSEVQRFDIGIMPLPDELWARGKSGYKLIQYMACGLPVVASPVGVNAEIVLPETGLLATTQAEWRDALIRLIGNARLRRRLGAGARERVVKHYSLASQAPRLASLIRSVAR